MSVPAVLSTDVLAVLAKWGASLGAALDAMEGRSDASLDEARENYQDFFVEAFGVPDAVTFEAVDADGVPAEWVVPDNVVDERNLLYLHGGAYLVGGPRGYRGLAGRLALACRARVLVPHYRLAPEHAFDAPLTDCLTAYRWMLAHGVEPSRLVVLGDSAGGTLAVSVQVALRDAGDPLPAAGVAISPWANLTHSGESFTTKVGVDPLCTKAALDVQAALFLGGAPADDARVSPVFADVHGLSPTLVQIGEAEVMLSDAVRLADRLATAAVQTRLDVWPGMFHVWHLFAETMPEAARAIDDIAAFIDRHTGG